MPEQMSKAELLTRMQVGHEHLNELLAECNAKQMIQAGAVDKWSVKDILAHIAAHQQRMSDWLEQRLQGILPATPQPYDMDEDDLAILNEQILQENRLSSLADVRSDLDAAHERALAVVESASETDLIDAGRCALRGGEPLWEAVAANSYAHYAEHGQDIRQWLQKEKP